MQREQSVTRPSVTSLYTDVHGKYPDPWKVGVTCANSAYQALCFPPPPKSLGTRLDLKVLLCTCMVFPYTMRILEVN